MTSDSNNQDATEQQQKRFEQLETLRKAVWESIVSRRAVEWKVSIALWTLFVAFIAAMISEKPELNVCESFVLSFFPMMLLVAHYGWLSAMFEAYRIDKTEEGDLRKEMGAIACYRQDDRVKKVVEKMLESRWKESEGRLAILSTMHDSQILTTILLAALSVLVVFKVTPSPATGDITLHTQMTQKK